LAVNRKTRSTPGAVKVNLISRAELARRLGVSRSAVTKECRDGGRIHEACAGTAVDVTHPRVQRWLAQRELATRDIEPPEPGARLDEPDPEEPINEPQDLLEALATERPAPLTDIKDPVMVERWVRTHKLTEEAIKAKRLRERVERNLLPKMTVDRIFAAVETGFRLLLSDTPRALAIRIAPERQVEITAMARDLMSQHLAAARARMVAILEADDPTEPLLEAAE
jgi:AcrR family transcriptional regulator